MAVKFPKIIPAQLKLVSGIKLGWSEGNIYKHYRKDVLIISIDNGASVSGVLTKNHFCAAPIVICREHLKKNIGKFIRALVINSGNANAGNGLNGIINVQRTCKEVAMHLGVKSQQVLPFSTGVILEPLPIESLISGISVAIKRLNSHNWYEAAQTIMTTDTMPKAISHQIYLEDQVITITGISKGSGMIHPKMATMLGFIATDANIKQSVLDTLVKDIANNSFNCISVDGDTSTNDAFILIATGHSSISYIESTQSPNYKKIYYALTKVACELAQLIIRDAEGATKFITINVEGGLNSQECREIADLVAKSPLVKTAFYASDPNFGRILAAIGSNSINKFNIYKVDLYLDNICVVKNGVRNNNYCEEYGKRIMHQNDITIRIVLGRGKINSTIWTCDLSNDYININSNYRS